MDSENAKRLEKRERERSRLRERRTDWFVDAGYGLMTHDFVDWCYIDEKPGMDTSVTIDDFEELVEGFDVELFADQVEQTGAGYLIFALGQSSGYYCAPNPVYEEYLREGGVSQRYTTDRDLPMELAEALEKRGIGLLFYASNGGARNPEVADAMDWPQRVFEGKTGPFTETTKEKWENILEWWGSHYGEKLDGWWHDSLHWPAEWDESKQHNFSTLAASLRAGNTDRIITFNLGSGAFCKLSESEDYVAGEETHLDRYPDSRWAVAERRL